MTCRCWECRRCGGLREIAPRLARARAQWFARRRERRQLEGELLRLERLVVHRELQMLRVRNNHTRYLGDRQAKLDEARRLVARWQRRIGELAA